jgi:oligopeptide/dipeptide ABC transporter ATP-binding protein
MAPAIAGRWAEHRHALSAFGCRKCTEQDTHGVHAAAPPACSRRRAIADESTFKRKNKARRPAAHLLTGGSDGNNGIDTTHRAAERRAMILQDPMASLNPLFSIFWQVAEPAYHHQGIRGRPLRQRVQELLRAVRIASPAVRMREFPHQMSGGMRQRVVGAIAMAGEPKLIIADEPTTNLDVTIQAQYLDVLKDIQQRTGVALIFVTHNLGIVAKMCDKMAVMYAGKIVEQGAVRDLFRAAKHPYTQALLGSMPKLGSKEPLYAIPGQPPNLAQLPGGCAFHPRCAHAMPQCAGREPAERSVAADWTARCWLLDQPAEETYARAIA